MARISEKNAINIKRLTLAEKIDSLKGSIEALEEKHGCSSGQASEAIKAGIMSETMEISQWLFNYRTLTRLEELSGGMIGTPTRDTSQSTIDS